LAIEFGKEKIYGYGYIVYAWDITIKSNIVKKTDDEDILSKEITLEKIDIWNKIFTYSRLFFRPTVFQRGAGMNMIPEGYLEKFRNNDNHVNTESYMAALRKLVFIDKSQIAPLYVTGDLLLNLHDSDGNIVEKLISEDSPEYINPDVPEHLREEWSRHHHEPLSIRLEFNFMEPEKMEYNLRILTYTDAWYNTRFYDGAYKNEIGTNKELATLNRARLVEFLTKIKDNFPIVKIEEESELKWRHKEPKITLLED